MKKVTVFALIFVLTLSLLAGCRSGSNDTSAPAGNTNSTGNMGGTNGNATDGDGIIGNGTDSTGNQRSGGMMPGQIHY